MRSLARLAPIALLLLIVVVALALTLLGGSSPAGEESALSYEPPGRFVAWRMAAELGLEPELWNEAPGDLPRGPHTLILFDTPADPPGYHLDEEDESAEPSETRPEPAFERRLRDPAHYLRFLDEGGTLLAGWSEPMQAFLVERLHLVELEDVTPLPDALATQLFATGDDRLVVEEVEVLGFPPRLLRIEMFLLDDWRRPYLVRLPVGRGSVCLVATTHPFRNDRMGEADNALLWIRVLERVHGGGRLLVDEYSASGWLPESPIELAFAPDQRLASVHLLVLIGLVGWLWLRGGPFPRDDEALVRASALVRVRAHAGLLARSRRWHLVGRILARDTLAVLEGRRDTGLAEEGAEALAARVDRALVPHVARLGGEEGRSRARALLLRESLGTREELEDYARALDALEHKIAPTDAGRSSRATREPGETRKETT